MKAGKLFVVEGLDGSGKGTQAQKLCERLQKAGILCEKISFPEYEDPAAGAVCMYLRGDFGSDPGDVNAFAASTFFAVDRFSGYKRKMKPILDKGGVVICDRYTTSNAIHQMAKLPRDQWESFLDWLYDFEFCKLGLPRPNEVIYLSMDVAVSQKLIAERCKDKQITKDIHEANVAYLKCCKDAAEHCAKKLGWKVIQCSDKTAPFLIEDIADQVFEVIQKGL